MVENYDNDLKQEYDPVNNRENMMMKYILFEKS
jgi:hypothetical protein